MAEASTDERKRLLPLDVTCRGRPTLEHDGSAEIIPAVGRTSRVADAEDLVLRNATVECHMKLKPIPDPEQFLRTEYLVSDLRGQSVRSGAVALVSQGIRFIVQLASTMMLSRLLTPQDFGLVAMVTAVTGFLSVFKDMGLATATIQRDDLTHAQVSTLFWLNAGINALFMVAMVAIAPLLKKPLAG